MTEKDTYAYGFSYEMFIRRAFGCDRGKHGADTAYLQYLLMADLGKNYLQQPYAKQLKMVKEFLIKAIDKFLTRKPTLEERASLEHMKMMVSSAERATELVNPIEQGLIETIRYRDL